MKVRKLAVALALVGGLGSGMANALGLGEVELQSYLNEPLDADIALRNTGDVGPKEVFVNLASSDVFNRVGISRDFFLTNLQFEVSTAANGQLVVHVTTKQPVREPYLNFLIEVTWPSGKLLREYSMLLDPPVYADRQSGGEPVSVPRAAPRTSAAPQPSRQQAQQPTSRPAPTRSTSGTGSQSSGGSYGDTFGPTGAADTLWGIALQVRPNDSYTPQRVMLALQDQNPDAFIDGNINRLKRGQVLRIPTADQIESRTNQQAYREVVVQNKAFNQPAPSVDATGQQPESTASGSQQDGDELRLSASSDDTLNAAEGGSAGGDEGVAGGADGSSVAAMEQLDKTQRENEELNTRVQDLESQLETMQRLVELKNNQLAEMQGQAAGAAESDATPADNAEAVASPETADSASTAGETEETEMAAGADDMPSDMNADGSVDDETAANDDASESAMPNEEGEGTAMTEMGADDENANAMAPVDETDQSSDTGAMDSETAEDMTATDASAMTDAKSELAPEPEAAPVEVEEAPKSKGFFGDLVEQLKSNTLYQVIAGGVGILVLLLLALLARRNANREKAFYDQLNSESDHESETIDLDSDDYDTATEEEKDALAEANAYIAYGRLDQASEVLESAISREPSRTDLRLKLLSVYAVGGDRDAFERQYGELEVLEDAAALAEADVLKKRLAETESTPSIDELESQLRSESMPANAPAAEQDDGIDDTFASLDESAGFGGDSERSEANAPSSDSLDGLDLDEDFDLDASEEKSDAPIEYDISGLDLESDDSEKESDELSLTEESVSDSADGLAENKEESLDIDFTLEEDLPESDEESTELSEDDFGSLDLDDSMLEESTPATDSPDHATSDDEELPSLEDDESALATDDEGKIDESFLDDLDAELDKVANEPEGDTLSPESDELDELELDVSDDDLALMDEVSGDDGATTPDLDEELGLEDSLLEDNVSTDSDDLDADVDDLEVPELTPAEAEKTATPAATELDESAIDDEDDFDFLAGTDEAATKLDLARAYIEMGDADGARDILEEVAIEGSEEQKTEAQELLKNIS